MSPSAGTETRTFVEVPGISVHACKFAYLINSTLPTCKPTIEKLIRFVFACGVTDAKVPSMLFNFVSDPMQLEQLGLEPLS